MSHFSVCVIVPDDGVVNNIHAIDDLTKDRVFAGSRMAASTPFTMMLSTSPSSLRRTGSMRSARIGIERANSRRRSPKRWSW